VGAVKKSNKSLSRYLPLVIIGIMVVFLAALIYPSLNLGSQNIVPISLNPSPLCKDGMSQSCSVGSCGGVSTCTSGSWSGCVWQHMCIPGQKVDCLNQGCSFGYKVCNECGTGYGQCINTV
jgi:hypothetical protein